MSLVGKVAVITGGTQGIGRAFTESLLAEGAYVAMCDVCQDTGDACFAELIKQFRGRVKFIPCDVTNERQFEDLFKRTKDAFNRVNIVINNAGISDEREENWTKLVEVNLMGVIRGTKLGLKHMSKEFGGWGGFIINIASVTALEPFPSLPIYSATKAAVNQLSRSYGTDLYYHKTGVKVMAINPGMTKTPMALKIPSILLDEDTAEYYRKHISTFHFQNVRNMGKGLLEVLRKAQNGSIWTIENDRPLKMTVIK